MTLRKRAALVAASTPALLPALSHAAIDVTSVTTGVAEISVAIAAVIGAMLAVSVAILGIGKVYAFVKRRAGG